MDLNLEWEHKLQHEITNVVNVPRFLCVQFFSNKLDDIKLLLSHADNAFSIYDNNAESYVIIGTSQINIKHFLEGKTLRN